MQSRRWCFTLNNPDGQLDFADSRVRLAVWQLELAPETGTPHFQGYINFENNPRLSVVKAVIRGEPHCEPARGTHEECVAYCTKEESRVEGPWFYPDEATVRGFSGQGARTDLAALAELVKQGKPMAEVAAADPATWIRNYRGLAMYNSLLHPPAMRESVRVTCMHGPPGIGKSTAAYHVFPDIFPIPLDKEALWFDGYTGQSAVLLDDYAGQLSISTFNRICDPFPFNAPVKGGFVAARWTTVVILCNADPCTWYRVFQYDAQIIDAVYRRIGYGEWAGKDPNHVYNHYETREQLLGGGDMQ